MNRAGKVPDGIPELQLRMWHLWNLKSWGGISSCGPEMKNQVVSCPGVMVIVVGLRVVIKVAEALNPTCFESRVYYSPAS